jgi:hypothetical protein
VKEGVLSTVGPDGVVKLLNVEGNVAGESRAAGGLRREHCGSVARLVAPSTAQAKEPRQARRVRIEHISSWSANRSTSTASQSIVHTCRKTAFFAPMHVLLRRMKMQLDCRTASIPMFRTLDCSLYIS